MRVNTLLVPVISAVLVVVLGCTFNSPAGEPQSSSIAPPDDATGTIRIGSETVEMTAQASWHLVSDPDCTDGDRGQLIMLFAENHDPPRREFTIAIPFDGQNVPSMPLQMEAYGFGCGSQGPMPVTFLLSPPPHNPDVNFSLVQGTIDLEIERNGDVVSFSGHFEDVEVMTRDGLQTLHLSGDFEEEGGFVDGTIH